MHAHAPFRDAPVTTAADAQSRRSCPICGEPLSSPRATYCSHRHRMVAFRRRHAHRQLEHELSSPRLTKPTREHVVYQCQDCEARYLGEQRCSECNRFCRRLGPGGCCPGCDEIVTVDELLERS